MDPEDGRLTVYGVDDEGTTAFTDFGIENLKELIEIDKADPAIMERYRKPAPSRRGPGGPRDSPEVTPLPSLSVMISANGTAPFSVIMLQEEHDGGRVAMWAADNAYDGPPGYDRGTGGIAANFGRRSRFV